MLSVRNKLHNFISDMLHISIREIDMNKYKYEIPISFMILGKTSAIQIVNKNDLNASCLLLSLYEYDNMDIGEVVFIRSRNTKCKIPAEHAGD